MRLQVEADTALCPFPTHQRRTLLVSSSAVAVVMRWCFLLFSTRKHVRELLYLSALLCGDLHTCLPALNVWGVTQQHPKAGWCWRWRCWLAGTCGRCSYYRHCAALQQSTLTTIILGGCWIGVSPSLTKCKAVLRKVLSAFYCELKVLTSSSGGRDPSSSYLGVKNFKLFWVALENLLAVKT